ncbi:MAG: hypothetical protein JHD02_04230 [Thermoleophilaceae bacterium]|nr:hypothetical protein [Thermoleophilaceae bacterium]
MKFRTTNRFERDLRALAKRRQAELFLEVVGGKFTPAAERFVNDPGAGWPKGLRVKSVADTPGVWEFTWSMKNPEGRATFEWIAIDGEPAVLWRRVGDHSIFSDS